MNNLSFYNRVKTILQETGDAYNIYTSAGPLNMDYADFLATNCFREFDKLLAHTDLCERKFKHIVRRANLDYLKEVQQDNCWASFMAGYMTQTINDNGFKAPKSEIKVPKAANA